jgi:hypothetical protein
MAKLYAKFVKTTTFPASSHRVACQELAARKGFSQVLMKAFKDGQKLQLSEAELQGVPEQLKKRWKGLGAPALCRRWEIVFDMSCHEKRLTWQKDAKRCKKYEIVE